MNLQLFFDYFTKHGYHLIIIDIVIGFIIYQVIARIIKKGTKKLKGKRGATIETTLLHVVKYFVIIVVILLILGILGVDVTGMFAGVGIISLVVGLAFQDIMKDYLVGISTILEEHYDVGDYVEINAHKGIVKRLNLKTTTIQTFENAIVTIPNRMVAEVVNYSKKDINIILSIPVPYSVGIKEADKLINNIIKSLEKEEDVIGKVDNWDFSSFEDSYIKYKLNIPVLNEAQFRAKRKANRIVKEEFNKLNISIPFNIIEVKNE